MTGFGWRRPTAPQGRLCACGLDPVAPGKKTCHSCAMYEAQEADIRAHGDGKPLRMEDRVSKPLRQVVVPRRGRRR